MEKIMENSNGIWDVRAWGLGCRTILLADLATCG